MELSTKRYERVDLVRVSGRVDHQTAPELEKMLQGIIGGGRHNVVVDLSDASYISSAGLKVLQATAKSARGMMGGDVRLARLPANLKEVFKLTGFDGFFKIYDELVDAVGSF
jgi:anti-anti-sigma factor